MRADRGISRLEVKCPRKFSDAFGEAAGANQYESYKMAQVGALPVFEDLPRRALGGGEVATMV